METRDARLRSFILRIERIEEERAEMLRDIRDIYEEAKSTGYETRYMRQIIRLRKMEPHDRDEQDHCVDLYRKACGIARRGGKGAEPAEPHKEGQPSAPPKQESSIGGEHMPRAESSAPTAT